MKCEGAEGISPGKGATLLQTALHRGIYARKVLQRSLQGCCEGDFQWVVGFGVHRFLLGWFLCASLNFRRKMHEPRQYKPSAAKAMITLSTTAPRRTCQKGSGV